MTATADFPPAAQFNLTLTYLPTPQITSECFFGGKVEPQPTP